MTIRQSFEPEDYARMLVRMMADMRRVFQDRQAAPALEWLARNEAEGLRDLSRDFGDLVHELDNSGSNPALDGILSQGDGPFGRLNKLIAHLWRGREAQYGESGTSLINIRFGLALRRRMASQRNRTVLMDRFAHASVIGAAAVANLRIRPLLRTYRSDLDVTEPISADTIRSEIGRGDVGAVWITAPTYDGFLPDLAAIGALCREHNVLLIVDAAWGVLHGVMTSAGFPASAIDAGADAMGISLHKKGIGLSQSSAAIFNNTALASDFRHFSNLGLATTSPNYVAAAITGFDLTRLEYEAESQWGAARNEAEEFAAHVNGIPGCRVITAADLGPGFSRDPCHVVVHIAGTEWDGLHVQQAFAGKLKDDIELATFDSLMFLFGPEHVGMGGEMARRLGDVIASVPHRAREPRLRIPAIVPKIVMTPHEAAFGPVERVLLRDSENRIAAQTAGAYPPGQAIISLGEIISREAIAYLLEAHAAGARLKGVAGDPNKTPIDVVAR